MMDRIKEEAARIGVPAEELLERILWYGWEVYVDTVMTEED